MSGMFWKTGVSSPKNCMMMNFWKLIKKKKNLETEYRLFPPVTIFLDLFLCAGYFFNASD